MTTTRMKTIWEYKYCHKQKTTEFFSKSASSDIWQKYTFYSLVDNPTTFHTQETLYSFTDASKECETLQQNDYLVKVANAVAYFGEQYIIKDLNNYCETEVNEPNYRVQQFIKWHDVTYYIRGHNICDAPYWKQKQQVYNQIRVIAEEKGIPSRCWKTLIRLYQNRNSVCHVPANVADAESMKDYADNSNDRDERESVEYLYNLVLNALRTSRRGR
ncbi:unnamed protein product [Adineta steineri]|uniref:Uncharacterized protein n=1 Tax=Adineta steineri TaxID=433720 RepID=A0A814C042_9BILA|nr:unnamed protein product [Adineta steineri]CAF1323165.1 unnamed protein product [Adineta steineri]CAF1531222.1 unnamed protein product [Adineta steineri]CAF1585587.1 unnamed protein product [Adineta steineri]